MPRRWSRLALLLAACALVVAVAPVPPAAVRAQDEVARFAELIAARTSAVPLFGVAAGTMVQEAGIVVTAGPQLSVTDFSLSSLFFNPTAATTTPWDYGFAFHGTPETEQYVFVDSDGTWYYATHPEGVQQSGVVPAFDATPGAVNRLDLIVDGTRALFGVNGQFVASLVIPTPVAADVTTATGFFDDTIVPGREIGYDYFIVWPLPGPEPAPTPAVSNADIRAFGEAIQGRPASAPLAGPLSGTLEEAEAQVALLSSGVAPAQFHAQATFQVPEGSFVIPWSIGFRFGATPDGDLRVFADSTGICWFGTGAATPMRVCEANRLRTTPGEANTLQLIVTAERAFLLINDRLTTAVELPSGADAAALDAAAGLRDDQIAPGRVIEVSDFTVLPLAATESHPTSSPPALAAQDEVARFAELLAARTATVSLILPDTGTFVQEAGTGATARAQLNVSDFSASVIFTNPTTEMTTPWDYGFSFHRTAETGLDVIVDSDGTWYYGIFPQGIQQSGTVPGFDPLPGAVNRLDLIVDGTTALFGVNGEFVARLALPPPVAGDVGASIGFFDDTIVPGREIGYDNFIVWPLPGPEPPAPNLSPADVEAFGEAVSGQPAPAPLAGPLSGTMEEAEDAFGLLSSGVAPAQFHAEATFQVPEGRFVRPWGIGFSFGATAEGDLRVFADSNGFCWLALGDHGTVTEICAANGLRATPGEANTLELIATGERAFLVINGRLMAAVALPPDIEPAALDAAVGMLFDQVAPGRVTEISDFTVWPLPSQPEGPVTPAVTQTATPTSIDRE